MSDASGGTEGTGGTQIAATTLSSDLSMAGDNVCFTTVGIQNYSISNLGDIVVYPNPNNGNFTIDISLLQTSGNLSIRVLDIQGKVIHENRNIGSVYSKVIGLSNINPGMYFVQLMTDRGLISQKIICQ
jgi:hypothetical protein